MLSLLKDCPLELMGPGTGSNAAPKNYKIVYTSRREVYEASEMDFQSLTQDMCLILIKVVNDALATGAGGGGASDADCSAWVEVQFPSPPT